MAHLAIFCTKKPTTGGKLLLDLQSSIIQNIHNMKAITKIAIFASLFGGAFGAKAETVEPLKYGDMDSWVTRQIKESRVIGGHTKTLYEVGPEQTITDGKPYANAGGSPWGTSNVMAKVAGVTKAVCSVAPDDHPGHGKCAKLETHIENVKALGVVNMKVLSPGSLFLGRFIEPVTTTDGAERFMICDTKFTRRPKALRFDYKFQQSNEKRVDMDGIGRAKDVEGPDRAVARLYLQKRTEDAQGNITAKRVGTLLVRFDKSTDWVNGATFDIIYGDATDKPGYDAKFMSLQQPLCYTVNSKGKSVPVKETGWAAPGEEPTHIMLQFISSDGGTYVGSPGNTLWIDNVALVYE